MDIKSEEYTINRISVNHPVFLCGLAAVFCMFTTNCILESMTLTDLYLLFVGFGFVVGWIMWEKLWQTTLTAFVAGMVSMLMATVVNYDMVLSIGGIALLIIAAFILHYKGRLDPLHAMVLLFILGFYIRLCYVLYTNIGQREDMYFTPVMTGFSLYYFLAGLIRRFYVLFKPYMSENLQVVQIVNFFFANIASIGIYKILRGFGFKGNNLTIVTLLISTFPLFAFQAGGWSESTMSVSLAVWGLYYGFKWYRTLSYRFFAGAVLCILLGLGASPAALTVVPVLLILIVKTMSSSKVKAGKGILFMLMLILCAVPFPVLFYLNNGLRFDGFFVLYTQFGIFEMMSLVIAGLLFIIALWGAAAADGKRALKTENLAFAMLIVGTCGYAFLFGDWSVLVPALIPLFVYASFLLEKGLVRSAIAAVFAFCALASVLLCDFVWVIDRVIPAGV